MAIHSPEPESTIITELRECSKDAISLATMGVHVPAISASAALTTEKHVGTERVIIGVDIGMTDTGTHLLRAAA